MGLGDNLMATGYARGAAARGKRIAFGVETENKIRWDQNSEIIFRNNPNIAPPGSEGADDLEWVAFYKGHRIYNSPAHRKWIWNYDFKPVPGEMFFDEAELEFGRSFGAGFVLIEPNVPLEKSVAPNKTWPLDRYQRVADRLLNMGHAVHQFHYKNATKLRNVRIVKAPSFRHALAVLANAALYLGSEGGLHHGAAAVGIPAVVLFGGFIPPQVTGYDTHMNLTGGAQACGSWRTCRHCLNAMQAITAAEVTQACLDRMAALSTPLQVQAM